MQTLVSSIYYENGVHEHSPKRGISPPLTVLYHRPLRLKRTTWSSSSKRHSLMACKGKGIEDGLACRYTNCASYIILLIHDIIFTIIRREMIADLSVTTNRSTKDTTFPLKQRNNDRRRHNKSF